MLFSGVALQVPGKIALCHSTLRFLLSPTGMTKQSYTEAVLAAIEEVSVSEDLKNQLLCLNGHDLSGLCP